MKFDKEGRICKIRAMCENPIGSDGRKVQKRKVIAVISTPLRRCECLSKSCAMEPAKYAIWRSGFDTTVCYRLVLQVL
jgi:hypothetical protein